MAENTFDDPVLGRLVHDHQLNWWEGQVQLRPDLRIDFRLSTWTGTGPDIDFDELVRKGVEYLEWARTAETFIRQRIADELLDTYNDNWADGNAGTRKLTRDEFLGRLCAYSITLDVKGTSAWYYEDGDLFAGHWIQVRLDSGRSIFAIGLAG
jgi:hypothetical protein